MAVLSDDMAGIAVDAMGRVYVADSGNHQVQVFEPRWHTDRHLGRIDGDGDRLARPNDVAIAPDGSVYVSDEDNHRVVHFDADGDVIDTRRARSALDPANSSSPGVWPSTPRETSTSPTTAATASRSLPRMAHFSPIGARKARLRASLSGPIYLAVNDAGEVFVSDEGNNRIQVFQPALNGSAAATPEATS